jgi:hypothetical protein
MAPLPNHGLHPPIGRVWRASGPWAGGRLMDGRQGNPGRGRRPLRETESAGGEWTGRKGKGGGRVLGLVVT